MAASHIQSAKNYNNGTSVAVAFGANVSANNLLLALLFGYANSNASASVSDTRGNTWTRIGSIVTGGDGSLYLDAFYCIANGAGADTVTYNAAGSSYMSLIIAEYSGIATTSPLDVAGSSTGSSTSPSTSITTTNANDLIIGWVTSMAGSTVTITSGSGYTMRQEYEDAATYMHAHLEDKSVSATGAQTVNATLGSSLQWIMRGAAFKESAASTFSMPPNNINRRNQHLFVR